MSLSCVRMCVGLFVPVFVDWGVFIAHLPTGMVIKRNGSDSQPIGFFSVVHTQHIRIHEILDGCLSTGLCCFPIRKHRETASSPGQSPPCLGLSSAAL